MMIAIDGPAGAGKSSAARKAATQLGYAYIDTGAFYRTVGLAVLRAGKSPANEADVTQTLTDIDLKVRYIENDQRVYLNGTDVSTEIRTPEVSLAASDVAKFPAVRAFLLDLQRDLAHGKITPIAGCVLDGRDIGTVVLPDADVKIFLTAAPEIRAQRRWQELSAKGVDETYEKVLQEVKARDAQDTNRAVAPLRQAEDAVLLDSGAMTLAESVEAILKITKGGRKNLF